ncbi:hypothetical protein CHLNCDRAFT_140444 [Chlorella variabilis]|uniref:DUF924 domain-containing protein n=1 Tax=Chlorella variabilis TaxID=554065 RepID=E1Z5E2_CHLVA|nr:hypothetical protein CHLNCDRAFT_140444 [Chlorella variabilis]EFN58745.1 hypothetical protein CHLNCDRAFT_140444 [Chlorella variabilis]|eukprot:XP_005850847.1 hypothetical protein CHLNCDRAFT_140444 [Chlorella variabilis]
MAQQLAPRARAVLDFWLGEGWETAPPGDTRPQCSKLWFGGGPEVDAQIVSQFRGDCEALIAGQYDAWQHVPLEALAGVILGDQLMRNAFRGTPKMYAADPKVLAWSKALLASGAEQLTPIQQVWLAMTLMHSEELADQEACVAQFAKMAAKCEAEGLQEMASMLKNNCKYAVAHRDVVEQWGRFPHRNALLGREDTPEEAAGIAAGTIPKW